jgi:hypothetical protein
MESGSRYRDGAGQIIKIKFVKNVSGVIVADAALLIRVPCRSRPYRNGCPMPK